MVIFVGKFFGNMVISITTHLSFRLYGPFLAGPDVDHISEIDCIGFLKDIWDIMASFKDIYCSRVMTLVFKIYIWLL